jgi:Fe(3+) dicitrate transport protein
MLKIIVFSILSSSINAQDYQKEINIFSEKRPSWEEIDKDKILVGKKNTNTKMNYLPPIQTDNNRQLLSQLPGVFSPDQTTEPWTIINYRGFGTPQEAQSLLILQDGLPVAIDMYGQADHLYLPPAPLMESVQVIAGGSALLYGPASSGVLNYRSPRLVKNQKLNGRVNLSSGSYNLISSVNSLSGSTGRTSYYVGYYRKQGEGFQRTNADFSSDYLQLKTETYLDHHLMIKTSFQGFDADYGMPGGMALIKADGFNTWGRDNKKATRSHNRLRLSRAQLMLGFEKKISDKTFIDSQFWSSAYRKYNKAQTGSGFGKIPTGNSNLINNSHSYSFNHQTRIKHQFDDHTLTFGYLLFNTNSPSVNETGASKDSNHGRVTSRLYRKTRTQALFVENLLSFGKFSIVPGLRFENMNLSATNDDKTGTSDIKRKDTYNVFLGGVGSSYQFTEQTQLFANISQGFKPISYEEVLNQGNPNYTVSGDIKPSYNYFYEAGLRGENEKINWDSSLYVIQRQNILASTNNVLSNGGSARYTGIESSVLFKNIFGSSTQSEYDFYLNANFLNAKFHRGSFKGKTPGHAPSALLKYGLIYKSEKKIHLSLLGTFVHEHFSDDAHTSQYKVPSYAVYDFLFEYRLMNQFAINGAINNILDREYYSRVMATGVMPTMGRNFYLGMSHQF